MYRVVVAAVVLASILGEALAQDRCYADAESLASTMEPSGLRRAKSPNEIRALVRSIQTLTDARRHLGDESEEASFACIIAELKKRIGDLSAIDFYQKAVRMDSENVEYRLLYGDYFRRFRGPLGPLFFDADREYAHALALFDETPEYCSTYEGACKVSRSLASLYEREGVRIAGSPGATSVFFSTQNTIQSTLTEFDDIRSLTSQAAFSSSSERLDQPLDENQLRLMIPNSGAYETLNQLTVRSPSWPTLRFFFSRNQLDDGQVSNFFRPTELNDVRVEQLGVVADRPFTAGSFDLLLRGEVRRGTRTGLIEFLPEDDEDFSSLIGRAVASRFVGPNKLSFELTASHDAIDQKVETAIDRSVSIVAPAVRFQWFGGASSERPIVPRATEFFGGASIRDETFGPVVLREEDYFVAASVNGLRGVTRAQSWDVTIQPTLFRSHRFSLEPSEDVDALANSQWRTFVSSVYRLWDKENERTRTRVPPVVLLNLTAQGHYDIKRTGAGDFESYGLKGGAHAKLLLGNTSLLLSATYQYRNYRRLGVVRKALLLDIKMGF